MTDRPRPYYEPIKRGIYVEQMVLLNVGDRARYIGNYRKGNLIPGCVGTVNSILRDGYGFVIDGNGGYQVVIPFEMMEWVG